jgi:hypothetical protein
MFWQQKVSLPHTGPTRLAVISGCLKQGWIFFFSPCIAPEKNTRPLCHQHNVSCRLVTIVDTPANLLLPAYRVICYNRLIPIRAVAQIFNESGKI